MNIQHTTSSIANSEFDDFEQELRACDDIVKALSDGLVGKNIEIPGPHGPRKLVYADYVASGRALRQVEDFIFDKVLPFYANSHTEASYCGGLMTRMREQARRIILEHCGGGAEQHAVIFSGSGATYALNKLVHLLGVREAVAGGQRVVVLVGPYEHHSNILPWRETGAEVIEITESETGGPDKDHLRSILETLPSTSQIIAAFSAASNVTGIYADVPGTTRIVKQAGGLAIWDYAGGAPYIPIEMSPEDTSIDAVVMSPHKFLGGPGASGVLVVRRDAVAASTPSFPGGGTVAFVNDKVHDYLENLEEREEGGTPNIVGDIRAALVFIVKDVIGQAFIAQRNADLSRRAIAALEEEPAMTLLGGSRENRLPIFSFIVDCPNNAPFDYQRFTRRLSDEYGIQVRGGCACAGPYVHRLLNISDEKSEMLRAQILSGDESQKPGFVRLNFSVLMADSEVDFIVKAVAHVARDFSHTQKVAS